MTRTALVSTQTDAKSPMDESLMDTSVRLNDDDHETRILALEAGGGGGAGGVDVAALAIINSGLVTNDPRFFRLRYSPFQNILNSGEVIDESRTGFDPEGKLQSRWIAIADNDTGNTLNSNPNIYHGEGLNIVKNNKISFRLKKGENFFSIGFTGATTTSDSVTVLIDGVAVNTASVTDENGTAVSATFSTVTSTTQRQQTNWFFGGSLLSESEQMVVIENTDSGTDVLVLEFIEVGFRSLDGEFIISTDEKLHVSDGTATIRGQQITYDEADLTITATTGYGKTSAVIGDQTQILTILEGVEPAMTQVSPQEGEVTWSGAITTLKVKNSHLFPSSGFLLMSQPWGQHFIASYTSKTEATIAQHSFDGMLFSSQPDQDWTPLTGWAGASGGGASDFFGDLNINLWGSGGLEITSANNKINFKITINGVETSHTATIASGLYSANGPGKLSLNAIIISSMDSAKDLSSIGGNYVAEYNNQTQKWIMGATGGGEIDAIDFDNSSGADVANALMVNSLGYPSTDIADDLTYIATTAKQHELALIFQKGQFLSPDHPNVKINVANGATSAALIEDARGRLGDGNVHVSNTAETIYEIYVDPDVCGLSFSFIPSELGTVVTAQIDSGQFLYIMQMDDPGIPNTATRSKRITAFVSFPRGSKTINLRAQTEVNFEIDADSNQHNFIGAVQYHTRPPLESLSLDKAAIKCFDIAPKQLFKTYYGEGGASFYSPTTNDNIDTITQTGSWAHTALVAGFNGNARETTVVNDTFDVTFETKQNGGGIGFKLAISAVQAREVEFYLVDGSSASETNTLIQVINLRWNSPGITSDTNAFELPGMDAGQYTLRLKQRDSGVQLLIGAVFIIDGEEPDPNSNTVTDLANNLQSVAFPIHTINLPVLQDGVARTPDRLSRSGYNEGKSVIDYSFNNPTFTDADGLDALFTEDEYYGSNVSVSGLNDFMRSFFFCKSFSSFDAAFTTSTTTVQALINGRTALNTYDQGVQTKAGSAPSSSDTSSVPLFQKNFFLLGSGNMSDSTTFIVTDTRGNRVGQKVIVKADGETTVVRFILSITTDTNIVFTEAISAFANFTTANNTSINFSGFHTLRLNNDNAGEFRISALKFEPLDVIESNFAKRTGTNKKTETESRTFPDVASGDDLYYPSHSDGVLGNYRTSSFSVTKTSSTAQTWDFPENLKNISVSTGTIDVKITSTREVSI